MATGSAVIDFGAAPGGNYATAVVTGQGEIVSGSLVEAWMMASSTADHNAIEHIIAPIKLTVGDVVAGVGFTVHAASEWRLTGDFAVRWVWV